MIDVDFTKISMWRGLRYWSTGEWQAVDESLKQLTREKKPWNPGRQRLFRAMDLCPLEEVRVVILGQDPYPDPEFATGLAFDIGSNPVYPPSMRTILKELKDDLDIPHTGNLEGWAKQGVLLWNLIPSCGANKSLSHDWNEWEPLSIEVLQKTSDRNAVFGVLGSHARRFRKYIDENKSDVIYVDHPAARGNSPCPFKGSRFFSNINHHLSELGHKPIDWRL